MSDILTGDNVTKTPEELAAILNKKFGQYNELLSKSATKDDFARLALEIKETGEALEKFEGTSGESLKTLKGLEEVVNKQGERLTQLFQITDSKGQKKSFVEVLKAKMEEGVFSKLANREASNAAFEIDIKALDFLGADQAGSAVQAYKPFDLPVHPYMEPFDVRLVFPTGSATMSKLEFPQEKAYTDNMGNLAENAASAETAITFEMVAVDAKRTSTHIKVSRWALNDINWLSTYISNRLMQHFIKTLNTQVLVGDGLTVNHNGIYTQAPTIDFTSTTWENSIANGAGNYIDVLIQAKGFLYENYNVMANAVLVNPVEWSIMTSTKTTTADWVSQPPIVTLTPQGYTMVNGMLIIPSKDIPADKYMVSAIDPANVQILFNGGIEILATDSDADDFQKNLVTIKLEANTLLPLYHAGAFNKGTFSTDLTALEAAAV